MPSCDSGKKENRAKQNPLFVPPNPADVICGWVAESEDKGRCINCGFLGKHPRPDYIKRVPTPCFYEMEQSERESGNVWDHTADTLAGRIGTEPICFRGVIDMKGEVDAILKAEDNDKLAAQRVFNENRNCQLWYPYTPGFTPKEHLEKLIMETTENSRKDFELRLEKDRKEFDLKLFEISQKIQEDSRKIANRSFWFNFFFTLVLVFLTPGQIWLALGDNRFLVQELVKLLIQKLK